MKKWVICLLTFVVVFSASGCVAGMPTSLLTKVEEGEPIVGAFSTPPAASLVTKDGNIPLQMGGFGWNYDTTRGPTSHVIADQAVRPLPLESMETVRIVQESPIDGMVCYMGEHSEMIEYGVQLKLDWQVKPDTLTCTFWPADYEKTGKTEYKLLANDCDKDGFMAHLGDYIYEFTANWAEHGSGYSGNATYYIHVIVERKG